MTASTLSIEQLVDIVTNYYDEVTHLTLQFPIKPQCISLYFLHFFHDSSDKDEVRIVADDLFALFGDGSGAIPVYSSQCNWLTSFSRDIKSRLIVKKPDLDFDSKVREYFTFILNAGGRIGTTFHIMNVDTPETILVR